MFYATAAAVAEHNVIQRFRPNGMTTRRRPYFGPPPSFGSANTLDAVYTDAAPGEVREPQAFMVEQQPESELGAHFHFVDQFQIVVHGTGHIGQHEVEPYTLHFASACTGYGPIKAGSDGIKYLTLRAAADSTGAQYLPEARHRQRATPKRNVMFDQIKLSALLKTPPTSLSTISLIEEAGGLAAQLLRIPSGASGQVVLAHAGSGQTIVVLTGSVNCRDAVYEELSVMFTSADEPAPTFTARDGAADVLILQYPAL